MLHDPRTVGTPYHVRKLKIVGTLNDAKLIASTDQSLSRNGRSHAYFIRCFVRRDRAVGVRRANPAGRSTPVAGSRRSPAGRAGPAGTQPVALRRASW